MMTETKEDIERRGESVHKASDLKEWSHRDLSELFWIHLIKYVKEPNEHSLYMMDRAMDWAAHDDHGLANSFRHALEWCGIDIYTEQEKWEAARQGGTNEL